MTPENVAILLVIAACLLATWIAGTVAVRAKLARAYGAAVVALMNESRGDRIRFSARGRGSRPEARHPPVELGREIVRRRRGRFGASTLLMVLWGLGLALLYLALRPDASRDVAINGLTVLLLSGMPVFGAGLGAVLGRVANFSWTPFVARRPMFVSGPFAWVTFRLARQFVRALEDLATPRFAPGPRLRDGRYGLRELPCAGRVWSHVVGKLCDEASVVVMDLRGFTPERAGARKELRLLRRRVAPERVVLVVDGAAGRTHLDEVLELPGYEGLRQRAMIARVRGAKDARRQVLHAALEAAGSPRETQRAQDRP